MAERLCRRLLVLWAGEYEDECCLPEHHEGLHHDLSYYFNDDGESWPDDPWHWDYPNVATP